MLLHSCISALAGAVEIVCHPVRPNFVIFWHGGRGPFSNLHTECLVRSVRSDKGFQGHFEPLPETRQGLGHELRLFKIHSHNPVLQRCASRAFLFPSCCLGIFYES